jgi:two-component system response regulator FixJ
MTAPAKQNRAYLVADEQALRTSLEAALIAAGFETATFASQAEFLRAEPSLGTGCVIICLHRRAGFDLAEELRRLDLAFPTIIVADLRTPKTVTWAMKLGVAEVLPRRIGPDGLAEAIRRVLVAFKEAARTGESASTLRARFLALTVLEREIVERLAAGRTKVAVAAELGIERALVEAGCSRAMRKLRATNFAHLIRLVLDGGAKLSAIGLAVMAFAPRLGVM